MEALQSFRERLLRAADQDSDEMTEEDDLIEDLAESLRGFRLAREKIVSKNAFNEPIKVAAPTGYRALVISSVARREGLLESYVEDCWEKARRFEAELRAELRSINPDLVNPLLNK